MPHVRVSTLIFGRSVPERPLPEVELRLVSQRIPASELIARAVAEQLALLRQQSLPEHEIKRRLRAQYLEAADIEAQQGEGKIALAAPDVGATPALDQEVARTLHAFVRKRFKLFVDGLEVIHPDDLVTLGDQSEVKFVRLIPLVGG